MAKARRSNTEGEGRELLFGDKPPAELETSPEPKRISMPARRPSGRPPRLSKGELLASLEREAMASPSVQRSPSREREAEIPLPPPPDLTSPLKMGIGAEAIQEMEKASLFRPPPELEERGEIEELEPVPAEKARILATWGEERISRLQKEIDSLYAQVQVDVGVNKPISDYCMALLSEARALMASGGAEGFARAELDIEQVRARLKRARESDEAAKRHGGRILAWQMLWFAIFILSLFNAPRIVARLGWGNLYGMITPNIFIPALAWGGIGGVLAGFYSLPWHISRREYDSQYNIFYFVQPPMGVVLGGIIFLVLNIVFLALIGEPIGSPKILSSSGETASLTPHLLYLLACLAGFKQDFAYQVLDNVMRALLRQPPS